MFQRVFGVADVGELLPPGFLLRLLALVRQIAQELVGSIAEIVIGFVVIGLVAVFGMMEPA